MGVSQLGGGQSGLLLPTRNGFLNRVIFTKPGAINFTLPYWANFAKVAIIGGGGGGATIGYIASGGMPGAAGGAGGGFSQKVLAGVASATLTGIVGALGAGGSAELYSGSNQSGANAAGSNGGTTTLSIPGQTSMSATGGQGGSLTPGVAATGGVGSGGDLNANGGVGGKGSASTSQAGVPAGGGASGSPRGDGGRGGNAIGLTGATTYGTVFGAGGGWGGQGADALANTDSTSNVLFGPGGSAITSQVPLFTKTGTVSQEMGAPGLDPLVDIYTLTNGTNPSTLNKAPQKRAWWDLEDVGGWSGGYYLNGAPRVGPYIPGTSLALIADSGDGAGGSSPGATNTFGGNAGFGGGGAGYFLQGGSVVNPLPCSVGGGGGGLMGTNSPSADTRGNNGGTGAIIIWY